MGAHPDTHSAAGTSFSREETLVLEQCPTDAALCVAGFRIACMVASQFISDSEVRGGAGSALHAFLQVKVSCRRSGSTEQCDGQA